MAKAKFFSVHGCEISSILADICHEMGSHIIHGSQHKSKSISSGLGNELNWCLSVNCAGMYSLIKAFSLQAQRMHSCFSSIWS